MTTLQDIEDVQRGEVWWISNATEAWAIAEDRRKTIHILLCIIASMGVGLGVCGAALVYVAAAA
jgi:hypothetical protein|tara:strand:+ start:393 stop:584 length:192 start_codon:yes stop_codon:yes gene_type:complete